MTDGKDKIYIDIDDEITAIIEKLKKSHHKIVALVLPKRASALQSIVNMRLLKKAGQKANKNIVLVTSEAGLLPLAGAVGLHVAESLASKPKIPPIPVTPDKEVTVEAEEGEPDLDKSKSIGELAGEKEEDVIEVDNTDLEEAGAMAEEAVKKGGKKHGSKFKIPNFEKFRLRLLLIAGGAILLIVLWVWGAIFAPRATVRIKTETSTQFADFDFIAKTDTQTPDYQNAVLPAENRPLSKSIEQKITATGQKNTGNKATGKLTLKNCTPQDGAITVPAGTNASSGNFTFVTDAAVTLPASSFSGGGSCTTSTEDVNVTAKEAGGAYNLSSRSYTLSGFSEVNATGSAMSGGTDNIIKVVSDKDIEKAREGYLNSDAGNLAKDELKASLSSNGLFPVAESFTMEVGETTSVPKVGEEASEATVTAQVKFTMLGVKQSDLEELIKHKVGSQIDTSKQKVQDSGLKDAVTKLREKKSDTDYNVSIQVQPVIGPNINEEEIKNQIRGKKRGFVQDLIGALPGVKEVNVEYSPFWVLSTPKATKKITIVYE